MKKDIKQLIAEGESQQTEFKSSFNVEAVENGEVATKLATNLHQLATNLSVQVKELIISLKYGKKSASELLLAPELAPELVQAYSDKAPSYFKKRVLYPAVELGLIAMLYPDKPKHPKQKYYLTEKGKEVLKALQA